VFRPTSPKTVKHHTRHSPAIMRTRCGNLAKRPDRGERAVWLAGLYNMGFPTLAGMVFAAAAREETQVRAALGCTRRSLPRK
jgi:hypothetical protein